MTHNSGILFDFEALLEENYFYIENQKNYLTENRKIICKIILKIYFKYMKNNIKIEPFSESHLEKTFEWMQDEELKNDFLIRRNINKEAHQKWFNAYKTDGGQKIFAIIFNNIHCGNCGLKNINYINKKAEFWIYLGEKQLREKGIAKNATNMLLDFAFNNQNLDKIYLHVVEFNTSAKFLYEKIGFKQEGFFINDIIIKEKPQNILRFCIFKNEFNK